ncbi:MAG TPA: hypothetical protein VHB21_21340 [Minicystis sp.]|nr:hypothetical protein [Minicystis sp.]
MGVDLFGFLETNVDIHRDPPSERAYFLAARFWFRRSPILRSRLAGGLAEFPRVQAPRGTVDGCSREVRSAIADESLEFVGWLALGELEDAARVYARDATPSVAGTPARTEQFEHDAPRAELQGLLELMRRLAGVYPAVRLVLALSA